MKSVELITITWNMIAEIVISIPLPPPSTMKLLLPPFVFNCHFKVITHQTVLLLLLMELFLLMLLILI
jgi:hypothetical protein